VGGGGGGGVAEKKKRAKKGRANGGKVGLVWGVGWGEGGWEGLTVGDARRFAKKGKNAGCQTG